MATNDRNRNALQRDRCYGDFKQPLRTDLSVMIAKFLARKYEELECAQNNNLSALYAVILNSINQTKQKYPNEFTSGKQLTLF